MAYRLVATKESACLHCKTHRWHPTYSRLLQGIGIRKFREGSVNSFDYSAPAELYPGRNRKSAKKVPYRRFETAADAIRFAVEELPELLLLGACIEVDEQRLTYKDIHALYASERYPLKRPVNRTDAQSVS
jgi:hypothetical protein